MSASRRLPSTGSRPAAPPAPAVLRLVQLVVLGRWRATGEQLYREVASITEAKAGQELLVSGCGDGVTVEWLARRTGASVTGVDPEPQRIERAEARARTLVPSRADAAPLHLSYQQAALDDLPHETAVFDAAVGEPAVAGARHPDRAVAELVRVTKPMGAVVLLQLTWGSELGAEERELLVERLGLRPHLLIEWKQMLRDAGVVDVQVQDWTSGEPGGPSTANAARDAADAAQLTWQQKVQIATRSWRKWGGGWRAARAAIEREMELLRDLSDERAIGFQLIKGVKWPHGRQNGRAGPTGVVSRP
jgi:SAM-dependent methyltransferase